MKFQLAINLERMDDSLDMKDVARHTLEMVQMADQGGFNIVWAAEHHALEMTIAPNPFSILTWWAGETDRIRLGTACVAAAYWHPIKVAGEAAFVDLISGGRLEFGIGSGAYQREFDRMHPGLKQSDAWQYMQEMLPAVRALWQGDYAPVSARGAAGGLILGGMAAFLVLETAEHARARGATALARIGGIASDAAHQRAGGGSAAAATALWQGMAAPQTGLGVISGMTGVAEARIEEEAFLAGLGSVPVRRSASLLGHGVEASFPANVALAALALSRGGFYPAMDPADAGDGTVERILVTGFGQWRGEALALLEKAP